jgi:CDP-glucose 4,6-dehydratase
LPVEAESKIITEAHGVISAWSRKDVNRRMPDVAYWRGKTVLLTGATGFFGGWMAQRLLELDVKLLCIVSRDKPASQFFATGVHRHATVYAGSVYDPKVIDAVFADHPIDAVFHGAYGADVNRVLTEPLECFRSSVESTWLLLETIRLRRPQCVTVVSSSDKAYGAQEIPYREEQRLQPVHPYEVAKASQDLAAQSYGKVFGLPVAVTRCANYFGGFDFNMTRLVPGTLRSVLRGQVPVLRSDGAYTRDYLYIEDAVDAHVLVAERLAAGDSIRGEAFNFSYGDGITIIDLVRRLIALSGSDMEPVIANKATAEIKHLLLDSSKARRLLAWQPRVGFEAGLEKTVKWYRDSVAAGMLTMGVCWFVG